jgi:asparagine synthase (glutamine-hydrolysing)
MFLLSKLVRETGFKVVLTGEGADEFLGGYDIFKEDKIRRFWARQPYSRWRSLLFKRLYPDIAGLAASNPALLAAFFKEGLEDVDSPWYSHAVRWRNNLRLCRFLQNDTLAAAHALDLERLAEALPPDFNRWEPLARAQYQEITVFMSQYLLSSQGDRMGMAHSIEGRFPFLDVRCVEFCNALPARAKLRGLCEKWLLKQAAKPWLPKAIWQRRKRPYRAPIHRGFFNEATPDYVRELLRAPSLKAAGIFKPAPVEALVRKVRSGGALGETDDMALVGVLSTQLLHHLFVREFRRAAPVADKERVKVERV